MDDYLSGLREVRQMVERVDTARAASGCCAEAGSGTPTTDAPFDVEELLGRCLGDPAFLGSILASFRDRAAVLLLQMEQALAAHDARDVARVAHGIKGAAANLSAGAVRDLAARLEELGNAGRLDEARQCQDKLRDRLQECIDYIPRAVFDAAEAAAKKEEVA